jgi:hypothetical protein
MPTYATSCRKASAGAACLTESSERSLRGVTDDPLFLFDDCAMLLFPLWQLCDLSLKKFSYSPKKTF